MKKTFLCGLLVAAGYLYGAVDREKILIVSAHPDDTVALAGTLFLMQDRFEVHVANLTKGERGLGEAGYRDGSTAAKRVAEEENAARMVGSKVHWLGFTDGELYATPEACASVRDLIAELRPRAIFAMWPIDRHQDHSMAGTIALKAMRLAGFAGEFYYYEEVYGSKGFVPQYFVDVSKVMDLKQRYVRCHVCQNPDDYLNRVETEGAKGRGYKSFYDEGREYAECFAPLAGFRVQGSRTVFDELPLETWRTRLPRPVCDAHPELVELYDTAWEIAHTRIDMIPGIPSPRYMDEGHRSDWIWIWDTCFMVHFCKYLPDEFPGVESLDNFYGILMAEGNPPLPKVRGNRWSCGPTGVDDPWEGRMLDFRVALADNPPIFAWTEYAYALQTGDRARLERIFVEKRWLQKWFDRFDAFDPSAPQPYGTVGKITAKRLEDGYLWSGNSNGMDNTPRGRKGAKDGGSPAASPDNPDLLWIDAIAQQGLSALCLAKIADLLGRFDEAADWRAKYEAKKAKVNALYWDEKDGFYYDILRGSREKSKVPTLASYWPMLAGMPTREMSNRLKAQLRDPERFGGAVPTPSLARNDPDFIREGGYWRGSLWLPTTYMTIKALDADGDFALARDLAFKVVRHMQETYRAVEPHTIWECYSPTEPKPGTYAKAKGYCRDNFCGWSALGPISLFIEDVIGIKEANAFTRTLVCDFERHPKGHVGVENYRFGDVVCSVIATEESVVVSSNRPFDLVVDGVKRPIAPGSATFARPVMR